MIVCHVTTYEKEAKLNMRRFAYDNYANIKCVFAHNRHEVITNDGNVHIFMGCHTYTRWCKGQTYILDGKLMHSGYQIKGENEHDDN